jgi:hypothetical protein
MGVTRQCEQGEGNSKAPSAQLLDCFVAALLAMTAYQAGPIRT